MCFNASHAKQPALGRTTEFQQNEKALDVGLFKSFYGKILYPSFTEYLPSLAGAQKI